MITLKDIQTRDITIDELKTMVVGFTSARKYKGAALESLDSLVVFKTFNYFVNAFKRLQIPNVVPEETTVTLARTLVDEKSPAIEINFLRKDGSTALNVLWRGKHVALSNENGKYAEGDWRADIRPLFKTLKAFEREQSLAAKKAEKVEKAPPKVLKKAASPKKAKTPADIDKAVAAALSKEAGDPDETVMEKVNEIVAESNSDPQ